MKLMIASDIHGSAYYCEKLLKAYDEEKADKLLLLGDILYHGPRNDLPKDYAPKQVIAMLNPRKQDLLCVRGNCDTEVDQMVLEFPILADYCILYLDEPDDFRHPRPCVSTRRTCRSFIRATFCSTDIPMCPYAGRRRITSI